MLKLKEGIKVGNHKEFSAIPAAAFVFDTSNADYAASQGAYKRGQFSQAKQQGEPLGGKAQFSADKTTPVKDIELEAEMLAIKAKALAYENELIQEALNARKGGDSDPLMVEMVAALKVVNV